MSCPHFSDESFFKKTAPCGIRPQWMLKQYKVLKNMAIIVLSMSLVVNVVPVKEGLLHKWISHLTVKSHSDLYIL